MVPEFIRSEARKHNAFSSTTLYGVFSNNYTYPKYVGWCQRIRQVGGEHLVMVTALSVTSFWPFNGRLKAFASKSSQVRRVRAIRGDLFVCLSFLVGSHAAFAMPDEAGHTLHLAEHGAYTDGLPGSEVFRDLDEFTAEFLIKPESLSPGILMMKTGEWNRDGFYFEIDNKERLALSIARDQRLVDRMWIKSSDRSTEPDAIDLSSGPRAKLSVGHDERMDDMTSFIIEAELRFSDLADQGFLLMTKDWRRKGFFFSVENKHLVFGLGKSDGRPALMRSQHPLDEDRWQRISAVKDGELVRVFVDGELAGEMSVPEELGSSRAGIYMHAGEKLGLQVKSLELTKLGHHDGRSEILFDLGFEEGSGSDLNNRWSGDRSGKLAVNQAVGRSDPKPLIVGDWHRVLLQKGKTRSKIFVDGEKVVDVPTPEKIIDTTAPLQLGATQRSANVQIKEFRLWGRPVAPEDLDARDTEVNEQADDVLAWLDFRDSSKKLVRDSTESGRPGRIEKNGSTGPLVSISGPSDADLSPASARASTPSSKPAFRSQSNGSPRPLTKVVNWLDRQEDERKPGPVSARNRRSDQTSGDGLPMPLTDVVNWLEYEEEERRPVRIAAKGGWHNSATRNGSSRVTAVNAGRQDSELSSEATSLPAIQSKYRSAGQEVHAGVEDGSPRRNTDIIESYELPELPPKPTLRQQSTGMPKPLAEIIATLHPREKESLAGHAPATRETPARIHSEEASGHLIADGDHDVSDRPVSSLDEVVTQSILTELGMDLEKLDMDLGLLETGFRRWVKSGREQLGSSPRPSPPRPTEGYQKSDKVRMASRAHNSTPSLPIKPQELMGSVDQEQSLRQEVVVAALELGGQERQSDASPPSHSVLALPSTAELIAPEPMLPRPVFEEATNRDRTSETTTDSRVKRGDGRPSREQETASAELKTPSTAMSIPKSKDESSTEPSEGSGVTEEQPVIELEASNRSEEMQVGDQMKLAKAEPADVKEASLHSTGLVKTPEEAEHNIEVPVGEGNLVRIERVAADVVVADPNVANVRILAPQLIYVFGNGPGRTDIFVLDSSQDILAKIDVGVVPDAEAAEESLRDVQPDTSADVHAALGGVVADGVVKSTSEARDVAALAENLETPELPVENNTSIAGSQQVNIRVRFAEVSRNDVFRLGLNWRALFETGNFLFGLTSGQIFQAAGGADGVDLPLGDSGSASFVTGDVNMDLLLDGLQREGVIRLLAEPNLTAVNGERATFLAGGEVPIPVPGGDDGVTIQFKQFGVSLDFTPTILSGERINLRVRPEVSELIATGGILLEGFNIPAFSVRRTDTSVELASGQTFAIAGLFQRNVSNDVDQFPGLGSLPIIGSLFTSKRYLRSETELVILITPYLVEPDSKNQLAVPGRDEAMQTVNTTHRPSPPKPIVGPASFILN